MTVTFHKDDSNFPTFQLAGAIRTLAQRFGIATRSSSESDNPAKVQSCKTIQSE
jgi:hypothetical protein